jgi:hypothetical protein
VRLVPFIPPFRDRSRAWLSVDQVARIWDRSPRMIRRWCIDGTLVSMGARVYRDRGKWWIGVSHSDISPDEAATLEPTPLQINSL